MAEVSKEVRGRQDLYNRLRMVPRSTQTLVAASSIDVSDAFLVQVTGTGGATTLTSTPTIADGFDGHMVLIRGMSDTDTVTIQDVSGLAGSNVDLGGANRTLGAGDYLLLVFNETTGLWEELLFKNN